MKRFDKGYIYSALISDLLTCLVIAYIFMGDFFLDETAKKDDILAAIPFFAMAFIITYLCFIAYRIVYYMTSGYELTEKEIKCCRGVLFKKSSVLEYTNIHAINKKQGILYRIFGIAVLTLDSGSANTSHTAEITVIEKSGTVDALIRELNALKEGGKRNAESAQEEILLSDNDILYSFTSKRKMLYTLISIASTAFFTAVLGISAITVTGIAKSVLSLDGLGTWGQYFIYAGLITLSAILIFSVISFIGTMIHSFIGYHDFKITRRGKEIQISYGLLERQTNTFSHDRIKALKISQGLVQRALGFATIKLEVIGYTLDEDNSNSADLGVLVPFCKYDEVREILEKVLPGYIPDEKQTKSVSFFPFMSYFMLFLAIVTGAVLLQTVLTMLILSVSSSLIATACFVTVGVAVILLIIKTLSAVLSYKTNGLAISSGKITAYYGGFTKNITVFMTKNLTAAENVTTPLRKKAGITSLVMHIKTNEMSNEIKVHIQKDGLSKEMEDLLIL